MAVVDLRSDILVRPTPAMMMAMAEAANEVRSYGIRECPIQRALETRVAQLLGKEDALFFPSCTMANQAALMAYCRRGEVALADAGSHLVQTEASNAAGLSGVAVRALTGVRGHLEPETVARALDQKVEPQSRRTALVWLENTHNSAGGTVLPEAWRAQTVEICRSHGVATHMDGARLWNAAEALQCPPCHLVEGVDSVVVSMSKALGAPLGAVLAGRSDVIAQALQFRQMFGGGWRRAGIVAAAAIVALDTMVMRLGKDHARARRLALAIGATGGALSVDLESVQSNIVKVAVDPLFASPGRLCEFLAVNHEVKVASHGPGSVRAVIHAEIGDVEIERAVSAFAHASDMVKVA